VVSSCDEDISFESEKGSPTSQMTVRNSWLLAGVLVFVLVPWGLFRVTDSFIISAITGFLWLAAAVIYCRHVRTNRAWFIFLLTPIALGPFLFVLLLFMGVLFGFGH